MIFRSVHEPLRFFAKRGATNFRTIVRHMHESSRLKAVVWFAASRKGHISKFVKFSSSKRQLSAVSCPCSREKLGLSISLDLFACTDARFMDMFVAPGAVESMQAHKETLEKKAAMLAQCKDEFRTLARQL
jgi:hypothetical protein